MPFLLQVASDNWELHMKVCWDWCKKNVHLFCFLWYSSKRRMIIAASFVEMCLWLWLWLYLILFDAKIIEMSLLVHSWLQTPGLTWVNRCLTVMVKHRSGLWTCRPKVFWTSSWSAPSSELWQNDHPTPLSAPLLLNACVKDDLRRTVARATLTNSGWWTLSSR